MSSSWCEVYFRNSKFHSAHKYKYIIQADKGFEHIQHSYKYHIERMFAAAFHYPDYPCLDSSTSQLWRFTFSTFKAIKMHTYINNAHIGAAVIHIRIFQSSSLLQNKYIYMDIPSWKHKITASLHLFRY